MFFTRKQKLKQVHIKVVQIIHDEAEIPTVTLKLEGDYGEGVTVDRDIKEPLAVGDTVTLNIVKEFPKKKK